MSAKSNESASKNTQEDAAKNFRVTEVSQNETGKNLTPQAERALQEAELRRKQIDQRSAAHSKEVNGRGGLDPVRFDDWEIKGVAVDF